MENKKQTPIEFLENKIDGVVNSMIQGNRLVVRKAIKQAKEIENKQECYTEEDMKKSFNAGVDRESYKGKNFEQWFEQFKNK